MLSMPIDLFFDSNDLASTGTTEFNRFFLGLIRENIQKTHADASLTQGKRLRLVFDNARTPSDYLLKRAIPQASGSATAPMPGQKDAMRHISAPRQTAKKNPVREDASLEEKLGQIKSSLKEDKLNLNTSRWEMMADRREVLSTSLPTLPRRSSGKKIRNGHSLIQQKQSLPDSMKSLPYENGSVLSASTASSNSSAFDIISSICSSTGSDSVTISTFSHQSSVSASTFSEKSASSAESPMPVRPAARSTDRRSQSERRARTCLNIGSNHSRRRQRSVEPVTPVLSNKAITRRHSIATTPISSASGRQQRMLKVDKIDIINQAAELNIIF